MGARQSRRLLGCSLGSENCILGSCEHLPSVQRGGLVPQTTGSGCNSCGHKLLFPKKADSEICRWVYLMNSLENAYFIITFFFEVEFI